MDREPGISVDAYAALCVAVPLLWGLLIAVILGRWQKTPASPRKEGRAGEYDI